MSKLLLQIYQIRATFQVMCCETVAQGMYASLAGNVRRLLGLVQHELDHTRRIRLSLDFAVEQIHLWSFVQIIDSEQFEQHIRYQHVTVLVSFAPGDTDLLSLSINILDLKKNGLTESHAGDINEGEEYLMLKTWCGLDHAHDVLPGKNARQLSLLAGPG